jgi:hypothetical protein
VARLGSEQSNFAQAVVQGDAGAPQLVAQLNKRRLRGDAAGVSGARIRLGEARRQRGFLERRPARRGRACVCHREGDALRARPRLGHMGARSARRSRVRGGQACARSDQLTRGAR